MERQNDDTIWKWIRREVWLIAIVLGVCLFFYNQIIDIKINQATQIQKLDTVIAELKQHETETVRINDQLNLTFSDIYEKIGSKYIPKQ